MKCWNIKIATTLFKVYLLYTWRRQRLLVCKVDRNKIILRTRRRLLWETCQVMNIHCNIPTTAHTTWYCSVVLVSKQWIVWTKLAKKIYQFAFHRSKCFFFYSKKWRNERNVHLMLSDTHTCVRWFCIAMSYDTALRNFIHLIVLRISDGLFSFIYLKGT